MGLWARIKRLFSTNINAALDSVEDKELVLDQITKDMTEEVRKTKGYIADAMVHLRKLEREAEMQERMGNEYKNKAKAILSDDDETNDYLAREALARKKECEKIAAQYHEAAKQQQEAVDRLKKNLEGMTKKVEEAKRKKSLLIAKKRTAEAQMSIQGALASKPDNEAFEAFNKIEEQIDDMSVRAEIAGELESSTSSVDVQLEQITFDDDVESEFKLLQAEVGGLIEDKSASKKTVGPDEA